MKKKVLIIFKYLRANWNPHVIKKFSNYYDTDYLYLNDYKNKNFMEIINEINNLIKLKHINVVVFDVDYFKFINFFFINNINSKKKILITGDDFELHEINSITASACDIVLSHCPFSVLKYKEKGYEAYQIHLDNGEIGKNNSSKKDIDVLFFGHITSDRKNFLDHIEKEGINLKNIGYEQPKDGLAEDELLKLISKSKIVVNFSKSRTKFVKSYSSENIYKFYYQFKGRIMMAGLNGAACVSEYSPGQELFFNKDEIPTFFTKEECVAIINKMLKDEELLKKYTNKFTFKVQNLFENRNNFQPIYKAIEKSNHLKVKLIKIPYWYLRISAKNIILRNIKLSTLIKTIIQFSLIFSIIKNFNLLIKFLIIFESILNTFWYSFIFTLKQKK